MAKYLIEETLAPQTYTDMLKNPEDRFEVLKPLFKETGCNLEQIYASAIENKAYLLVESPDLESVYTIGALFLAGGAATAIKYIPLKPMPEVVEICRKAGSISYRPPGK